MSRKIREQLKSKYGRVPKPNYYAEDMEFIRSYFDFREKKKAEFLIDEITYHDLSMETIFKRINPRNSTPGEQYLYYMLRSPQVKEESYQKRRTIIDFFSNNEKERLDIQTDLKMLGVSHRADVSRLFDPEIHQRSQLIIYILSNLLLLATLLAGIFIAREFLILSWLIGALNSIWHFLMHKKIGAEVDLANYTVMMVHTRHRIKKRGIKEVDMILSEHQKSYESLKKLRKHRFNSMLSRDALSGMINSLFLMDFITFELVRKTLSKHPEDIYNIHEELGLLDSAIAIASYRESLPNSVAGHIDFKSKKPFLEACGLYHPLLEEAVRNDFSSESSVLITGSNASGKSTYLKSAVFSSIMAQSIMSVCAESFSSSVLYPYTSMALSDDILGGDSYYIAETKSLKRILDANARGEMVLCAIDEVLRGTNTVERIAASTEILRTLSRRGALCVVASHDIELTELLKEDYQMLHFREEMSEGSITFDYVVHQGKATSRNAINLLQLLGFDDSIVKGAHERADRFIKTNQWS